MYANFDGGWQSILTLTLFMTMLRTLGYLVFGGFVYYLVWRKFRGRLAHVQIQRRLSNLKSNIREIKYSLITIGVWTVLSVPVLYMIGHGHTNMYMNISDHSWGYYGLSLVGMIFLHDAYFYFTHRLMHYPLLYKTVHAVHHQSVNPSPWAIFSFHPLEAVAAFGFAFVQLAMPVHPSVSAVWFVWMLSFNAIGHLGFELAPKGFVFMPVLKWILTSTHHNIHHRYVNYNFGVYFNIWDRLLGTVHPQYEEKFERVKAGQYLA